jgi:hypothetical protein
MHIDTWHDDTQVNDIWRDRTRHNENQNSGTAQISKICCAEYTLLGQYT